MNESHRVKRYPVLYVDDNPDEHLLFQIAAAKVNAPLETCSVTTPEAAIRCLESSQKPLRRLRSGWPAFILLDYQLAGCTSLELPAWICGVPGR